MKSSHLRNGLVVFQFSISIILIVGTFVVIKQMAFVRNQSLGFDREHVVVIKTYEELGQNLSAFKEKLLQNPSVIAASASTSVPSTSFTNRGCRLEGSKSNRGSNIYAVDEDFLDVMQMQMSQGRFFSNDIPTDKQAMLINESMVNKYNGVDLLNKNISIWVSRKHGELPFRVIGVIKDFHYESFYDHIKPLGLIMIPGASEWEESYVSVRIRPENIQLSTLAKHGMT
ncbi:ABC transporter permease [Calditrichota bacterium]